MRYNLDIVFEDEDIIVCYKPAGIATQTKKLGQQDMVSLIKNHLVQNGHSPYVGVVHRLDQPVEGVMVFAKNQKAAANLSKQVASRSIGKHYKAVCLLKARMPIPDEGSLLDYMTYDKKTNVGSIVYPEDPDSIDTNTIKEARLDYRVIGRKEERIFFDITLGTGRHHQIRLQLAGLGCPIVGDRKYGDESYNDSVAARQLGLCSYKLMFVHPTTRKEVVYEIKPRNSLFENYEEL